MSEEIKALNAITQLGIYCCDDEGLGHECEAVRIAQDAMARYEIKQAQTKADNRESPSCGTAPNDSQVEKKFLEELRSELDLLDYCRDHMLETTHPMHGVVARARDLVAAIDAGRLNLTTERCRPILAENPDEPGFKDDQDWLGQQCYRGNSVGFIYDKMLARGKGIDDLRKRITELESEVKRLSAMGDKVSKRVQE